MEADIFKGKSFLVGCIYRPHDSSSYLQKDFNKNHNEMLTKINKVSMEMLLLGDININYLVKLSHKEIKELFITHGHHQLVKLLSYVTQETKSLIDVIMTNTHSNVHHKSFTIEFEFYHCAMCVCKFNHWKMPFRTITCRDYSKYNDTVLAHHIENYNWNPVYTETNVNTELNYIEQGLTSIVNRHTPKITKHVKDHKCPWLTYKTKTLMSTRVLRKA